MSVALATAGRADLIGSLAKEYRRRHPQEAARVLEQRPLDEVVQVFEQDPEAAGLLGLLTFDVGARVLEQLSDGAAHRALLATDLTRAAQLLAGLESARRDTLLALLDPRAAKELRDMMRYPPDTAGALMNPRVTVFRVGTTVEAAVQRLRLLKPHERGSLYVIDHDERLVGAVPLGELAIAAPDERLDKLVSGSPTSANAFATREEIASLLAKHHVLAVPVVDGNGRLVGVVSSDEAMAVLQENFSDDYLSLAGTDAEAMERRTPLAIARLRLPWLLGTMAIELCAGLVIAYFDDVLKEVILLASFMPVISAVSGNVGLQAAAIVVRGLDTGHVSLSRVGHQVSRELGSSALMAVACGLVLGTVGAVWSGHPSFGIVIGVALLCAMTTAGTMGTVIPMLSKRLGFDPATTAGPFETAFQDVIGFAVFLWFASALLQFLR